MDSKYTCEFCKKEYKSIYSLNVHKTTTKFCLEIQKKINESKVLEEINHFNCEFCDKEFTSTKYLNQHLERCKSKKKLTSDEIMKKNNLLEKEIAELKLKLQFKDEKLNDKDIIIEKLEKELNDYKQIAIRPTTVVNNNSGNNYQIQYNQLLETIKVLDKNSLSDKINSISIEDIDKYDPKHLEESVSTSLSNILKDYTFCTDKSRKTVVIKKENNNSQKVPIDTFVNTCFNLGIQDIKNFLKMLEEHYDIKLTEYVISDEDFLLFDSSLQKIKEFINKDNIDMSDNSNPLKQLTTKILLSCQHINKN
jgi:hypothetical protein